MRKSLVKYCRVNQISEREIQIFLSFRNKFLSRDFSIFSRMREVLPSVLRTFLAIDIINFFNHIFSNFFSTTMATESDLWSISNCLAAPRSLHYSLIKICVTVRFNLSPFIVTKWLKENELSLSFCHFRTKIMLRLAFGKIQCKKRYMGCPFIVLWSIWTTWFGFCCRLLVPKVASCNDYNFVFLNNLTCFGPLFKNKRFRTLESLFKSSFIALVV